MSTIWGAALLSPPFTTLSYLTPGCFSETELQPGMRFLAPVANSLRVVMLLQACDGDTEQICDAKGAPVVLKPLLWPLERTPLLGQEYLDMIKQLALRQMKTPGQILGALLPLPLRSAQVRLASPLKGRTRTFKPKEIAQLPEDDLADLAASWRDGLLRVDEASIRSQEVAVVVKDPPWPVRPAATAQIAVLEYLWERGSAPRKTLLADLGESARGALNRCIELGLVRLTRAEAPSLEEDALEDTASGREFDFTSEQLQALDGPEGLTRALESDAGETRLLFGVTGSGKTAVYLELARRCLQMGRSVYLLAPEIALAQNLLRAVRLRFPGLGDNLHFYHGNIPPNERARLFRQAARSNGASLVVGTRSALFLPARSPGCVILDEEHDSSFKQDERLNYQAKEVAYFLMHRHKGLLLLGSATPDVKTFYAAEQGHAPSLNMKQRISECGLPDIDLVDIRSLSPTEHLLAPETLKALSETVEQGDQAIIMLNRRGYSPLMYCLDCGQVAKCPNCEIGLTYHKGRERLVCHYCGESRPFPIICSGCGGANYLPMGEGTERLEETLAATLPPETGVLRLDRDSTRRLGRMEEILESFARQEAQVLVGTQMLSKGHHFPGVTRVIVADGDLGLNLPDYRATERTFQLLVQVAGRAGRGERPGRVLIQTRDVAHPCWQYVRTCDYEGFYKNELELRRKRKYPPFIKLALIRLNYPFTWDPGSRALSEAGKALREAGREHGVMVLGPAPAPLKMLRGRRRFHCLLKGGDWQNIRQVFAAVAKNLEPYTSGGDLRLSLDLDPVDML